jgi:hypothetical protein
MYLLCGCDWKNAGVRSQAYTQESEDIELAVVWFGRFILGYWIRSIDARARLGHNHNRRVDDRSPRVTNSGSPARQKNSASRSGWRSRRRIAPGCAVSQGAVLARGREGWDLAMELKAQTRESRSEVNPSHIVPVTNFSADSLWSSRLEIRVAPTLKLPNRN